MHAYPLSLEPLGVHKGHNLGRLEEHSWQGILEDVDEPTSALWEPAAIQI